MNLAAGKPAFLVHVLPFYPLIHIYQTLNTRKAMLFIEMSQIIHGHLGRTPALWGK